MKTVLKKIDQRLDQLIPLLILLAIHVILRIPNLFEPHWYGDEAIYLTVGQALNYGQKLYAQIVDHKTPIIYFLARTPSLMWFKFLNLVWMSAALVFFYQIASKIFKNKYWTFISSLIFMLLTTLPWLEGNIANGELFVIGFVLAGFSLLTKSNYFKWLQESKAARGKNLKEAFLLIGSGALVGLGLMTKVPALLDLGAMMSIAWFRLINQGKILKKISRFITEAGLIFLGAMLPLIGSVLYFMARGTAQDYLQYGLLYNFHYAGTWFTDYGHPLINWLFTLKGKVLVLIIIVGLLSLLRKHISKIGQFLLTWLSLSLFAALLSNRPYPHYFLQLIPPLALVIVWLVKLAIDQIKVKTISLKTLLEPIFIILTIALGTKIFLLMKVHPYPTADYYRKFYQYQTKKISQSDYYAWFNPLTKDNYKLAPVIKKHAERKIFIWGTNPMLYAQTHTIPTGKFTVAFHIEDLDLHQQTLDSIKREEPELIVVMKDAQNSFPQLNDYLNQHYLPNLEYQYLRLYKRI